jgi:hypothetical protein
MFVRLGWKRLPGTNTLAYYKNYGQKKFYNNGPRKHFLLDAVSRNGPAYSPLRVRPVFTGLGVDQACRRMYQNRRQHARDQSYKTL